MNLTTAQRVTRRAMLRRMSIGVGRERSSGTRKMVSSATSQQASDALSPELSEEGDEGDEVVLVEEEVMAEAIVETASSTALCVALTSIVATVGSFVEDLSILVVVVVSLVVVMVMVLVVKVVIG